MDAADGFSLVGPAVSVVCSTYQRATRLPAFFAALENQSLARDQFEVVIVNNGSTDETRAVLDELAAGSPLNVQAIHLEKNCGAGGGRNAGWRVAQAPIVAFTDDDCTSDPNWLRLGLAAMTEPGVTVVVGRTEPNPDQAGNKGPFSRTQRVAEEGGKRYMPTCNIFYRRADLAAVDGFDPLFATKGGEDTDLGWRVLDSTGGAVAFAADALVLHDVLTGTFRGALREAATWRDIPLVIARYPKRARPILVHRLFWKPTHEFVLLGIGGVVVAAILRNPLPLVAGLPWVNARTRKWPISTRYGRITYLPHAFVIDVVEVSTMIRGSIRNRTFVL